MRIEDHLNRMAARATDALNALLSRRPRLRIENADGTRAIEFEDANDVIKSIRITISEK